MHVAMDQFAHPGVVMLKGTGVKVLDMGVSLAPGVLNSRDAPSRMVKFVVV